MTESLPLELEAVTVIDELFVSVVGVPDISPVVELIESPLGNVPELIVHVAGPPELLICRL